MKKAILSLTLIFSAVLIFAQDSGRTLPSVQVKDLNGKMVDTRTFSNDGQPVVISFWATWCAPCKKELNAIHDVYDEWVDETGVKVIAISIDDARSASRVKPYVNAQGWEYEVYNDSNFDFKRAMNVTNVPHTFLLDGKGNIVAQHTSYTEGAEDELFEEIKALVE